MCLLPASSTPSATMIACSRPSQTPSNMRQKQGLAGNGRVRSSSNRAAVASTHMREAVLLPTAESFAAVHERVLAPARSAATTAGWALARERMAAYDSKTTSSVPPPSALCRRARGRVTGNLCKPSRMKPASLPARKHGGASLSRP
jgi:hypothetical protein